jgi:hypothetical protein
LLFHGIKTNYTGNKIPLIPPSKVSIKVIYSPGIKVFYAGVVFKALWYNIKALTANRGAIFVNLASKILE